MRQREICPECLGDGEAWGSQCSYCGGSGTSPNEADTVILLEKERALEHALDRSILRNPSVNGQQ